MVLNKGGYVMINKAQDNVYELATSALTSGKPILWYETNTECYFIDTITLSGTDIILTKGGKTITIESDGDITEVGDIQNHLYKYYVSYQGIDEEMNGIDFLIEFISSTKYDTLTTDIIKQYLKEESSLATENESHDSVYYDGLYNDTLTFATKNYSYNITTLQDITFSVEQIF